VEPEKTPRERAADLISQLVPDWRPTPRQALWAIRIAIVLSLLIAIGYPYGIILWDWAKLLIVPAVIAGGGLGFNAQQREREQQLANERAQDEALQAYLDQIGQLLLDKDPSLRQAKEDDEVRTLARARTLTVLARLDGERKGSIVRFLSESTLIQKEEGAHEEHVLSQPVISLSGADLIGANLSRAELSGAYLRGVELRGAKLSRTLVTTNPLGQVKSLEGSTMPDGQKYEEWIKSREEDG
jgi:hypothetical protein